MNRGYLVEVFGEPGVGKTHQAHNNFPNAATIDTAGTQMGFREYEVKDSGEFGESYPIIKKINGWDKEETMKHYRYVSSFGEIYDALDELAEDHDTIVLDNASDFRVMTVKELCKRNNEEWLQQQEWAKVNDMVDEFVEVAIKSKRVNLVVISQMKDEYKKDVQTGRRIRDGPKRLPFKSDLRFKMTLEDGERSVKVLKNRFLDRASDEWIDELDELDFEIIMTLSNIPESEW